MVPSTAHSTVASEWLALAVSSITGLRRILITHRVTQVQYVKPQEQHIQHVSISLIIQLRLVLRVLLFMFLSPGS